MPVLRPPRPAVGSAVMLLLIAASATAQESASPVVVAPVLEREIRTAQRVVGSVSAARTSIVGSAVDGRVLEYLVEAGEAVTKGQPLAKLRTGTLEIELAAAKAELDLRNEELNELKQGSREEDIREAQAKAQGAKIVRENADRKLKRAESLYSRNAINLEEVEDLRASALAAEQSQEAAEEALQRIEAGPRPETIAQAAARQAMQQEQVRLIEDRMDKYIIRAPFDGFVSAERTQEGEWIQTGDPVAEIMQLDQVDVVANVPAEQAVRLKLGTSVHVEFPELPEQILTGQVARIIPAGDRRSRTFPVSLRLDNPIEDGRPLLMDGMLARIDLPAGTLERKRLVPKDALVLDRGKRAVFVVDPLAADPDSGTVRSVPVTLGVAVGTWMQVDGPLRDHELVVVRGNERLKDGQPVTIRERITTEPE